MFTHNINMFPTEREAQTNLKKLFTMPEKTDQAISNSISNEVSSLIKKKANYYANSKKQNPLS